MSQDQSLDQKQQWLKKILSDWTDQIDSILPAQALLRLKYRNKVCLSAQWDKEKWKIGLRRREEIIDLSQCPVHGALVEKAINILLNRLPAAGDFPMIYYVQSGAQVTLVVKQKTFPHLSWIDEDLISRLKTVGIEGLWLHLNPCAGRNVFAKNFWHLLWGAPRSRSCNGLIYGPKSFQQLIPSLYKHSLDQAEAFLSPRPDDLIVDLYCGGGAGLVRWTGHTGGVIGIELDGEAVDCAKVNAPSAKVLRGKCKDRIPQLTEWVNLSISSTARRLVYANPPRTGMEPEVIDWLSMDCQPERMAYLSCSAGTLRRDLLQLKKSGYEITRITPYDFFPQTHHVECLALLKRKTE
jgi:tRNA/tmRNA/rRNA uracil-C5-methylase (TrmA/RlmC/RlmD family)